MGAEPEQLVVTGYRWQRTRIWRQARDDSGRVCQTALGETDNPVLNNFDFCTGMAIEPDPPSIPFERHTPSFNSNNIRAHSTDQKRRSDPADDIAGFHGTVEQ